MPAIGRAGMEVLKKSGYSGEIFVVDNHSVDGSCAMVPRAISEVELIALDENLGFSKANNWQCFDLKAAGCSC